MHSQWVRREVRWCHLSSFSLLSFSLAGTILGLLGIFIPHASSWPPLTHTQVTMVRVRPPRSTCWLACFPPRLVMPSCWIVPSKKKSIVFGTSHFLRVVTAVPVSHSSQRHDRCVSSTRHPLSQSLSRRTFGADWIIERLVRVRIDCLPSPFLLDLIGIGARYQMKCIVCWSKWILWSNVRNPQASSAEEWRFISSPSFTFNSCFHSFVCLSSLFSLFSPILSVVSQSEWLRSVTHRSSSWYPSPPPSLFRSLPLVLSPLSGWTYDWFGSQESISVVEGHWANEEKSISCPHFSLSTTHSSSSLSLLSSHFLPSALSRTHLEDGGGWCSSW